MQKAILAGGCFWGMEDLLSRLPGVIKTRVGYSGGHLENPTYNDMRKGTSGHAESIEVTFDEAILGYHGLLEFFFQIHDPTTLNRQGNDRGSQYRSAIFYVDETQKKIALDIMSRMEKSGKWPGKIVTEVTPAGPFYEAEDVHQNYLIKNPGGYTCHFIRPQWKL